MGNFKIPERECRISRIRKILFKRFWFWLFGFHQIRQRVQYREQLCFSFAEIWRSLNLIGRETYSVAVLRVHRQDRPWITHGYMYSIARCTASTTIIHYHTLHRSTQIPTFPILQNNFFIYFILHNIQTFSLASQSVSQFSRQSAVSISCCTFVIIFL